MSLAHMGATPGFFSETTSAALTTKITSHKPNTPFFLRLQEYLACNVVIIKDTFENLRNLMFFASDIKIL